jgi:ABC-2 type transport system permease protein
MKAAVRAEWRKLRSTPGLWVALIGVVALTLVMLGMQLINAGKVGAPSLGTAMSARQIVTSPFLGAYAVLLLGVVMTTSEFRYQTVTPTFLTTPRRGRVVAAKVITAAAVGVLIGLCAAVVALTVGLGWLASHGARLEIFGGELRIVALALLVTYGFYAVLGVGVGALISNQAVAVVVPLAWFLVIETLVPSYGLSELQPWLPGGATSALLLDPTIPGLLPPWAGALLILAYGGGLAVLGARRIARSDIG